MQIKIVTFCKKWNDRRWSEKKVNKAIGEGVNKFVLNFFVFYAQIECSNSRSRSVTA